MRESLQENVKLYVSRHRSRKLFRKFVQVMGCMVAFVTTYALILPAITMEKTTFCGLEEHTHTETCYQQQIEQRNLICSIGSGLHVHSSDCYHENGSVICGVADYIVHSHDDSCRNAAGELVCTLPERSQHTHSSACYDTPEPVPHVHTDACMADVKGSLTCTQQVSEGHRHSDSCYRAGSELLCTQVEGHQHGDGCYVSPLNCTISTAPHAHGDGCYITGALICNIPENHIHQDACIQTYLVCGQAESDHTHDSDCYTSQLVCTLEHEHTDGCWQETLSCSTAVHRHTDACYESRTVCTIQEGHSHDASCYERILNCGKVDGEVHEHVETCYGSPQLICTLEVDHVHTDSCYQQELNCQIPKSDGHTHGDACYQWNREYVCGLEEGQLEEQKPELVCKEPTAPSHTHGADCFETILVDADPVCSENHEHTYSCYQQICMIQEHQHSAQCYSDPDADVETRQFWESTMKNVELTEDWNANVVAIAESQLGYTESTRNYTVWEDESRHGYTRYGAWYGVPHGDWCAMFASFCLEYAGVEGMPYNYGVRPWIEQLTKLDLYRTAEEYVPIPGDLVFFDWDEQDNLSDHVGIVYEVLEATEIEPAKLKTIEGNSSNRVQFVTYNLDDAVLLGYSMLPLNPDVEYICDLSRHVHAKQNCYDLEGKLICEEPMHIHGEECLPLESEELPPEDPTYYCGLEEHVHAEDCYDAEGNEICEKTVHEHSDDCLTEPIPEPTYYCGLEAHTHDEVECYDAEGNLTCELPEHEHSDACLTEPPTYYCGLEAHTHDEVECYDTEGNLTCELPEHEHSDACLTESPTYYCGLEAHTHDEVECYDAEGNLTCELPEHEHSDACLTESPTYYCGLEAHTHDEVECCDAEGNLTCELPEHEHSDACLTESPTYYCGLEAHTHDEVECYDAEGNLTCELPEHEHSDACLTESPTYYCGLEIHAHSEACLDEEGKLNCGLDEHAHGDDCLIRYYCGKLVHVHDEAVCFDADGILICEKPVHEHQASCLMEPKLYCTRGEHTHDAVECYDEAGNLTCEIPEHTHSEACWCPPMMMAAGPTKYYCGYAEEHTHGEACYDPAGGLLCELKEHTHTSLCLADLSDLGDYDRQRVEKVIRMIDELLSYDEMEEKILSFGEDEEALELWETEFFQKVQQTYAEYVSLPEEHRDRVVNRDKLLGLETIWSMMPLATYYVWLDGTNGNMTSLKGSENRLETLQSTGNSREFKLPETWKSPEKYSYTLRGWYAVNLNREGTSLKGNPENFYYLPGQTVTITENTVFYADWAAATYDIGRFNEHVVDTISTNNFITTKLYDYSSMFNMYSSSYSGSADQSSHNENWSVVEDNSSLPGGSTSFGLILRDWDEDDDVLSKPSNINGQSHYTYQPSITKGLLNFDPSPLNLFFSEGHLGVDYIGTADHLFQYDPDSGYYYYDSAKNAASYSQSAGRFYVYDYLERANRTQSELNEEQGTVVADFLPFNSPYANTNGKTVVQGNMADGQPYYQYDKLYEKDSSPDRAGINYWFGMHTDIRFYLPQVPGHKDASGITGNRSINGEEMIFSFSGDDDVWVLVDNRLVLDIGGIHKAKSGTINFSTGEVTVDGVVQTVTVNGEQKPFLYNLSAGEHHLNLYYMERGSSFSNCHIYFNISPRFMLTLKKQDLLTNTPLKDVTFGVYMDEQCTKHAELWPNYEASLNSQSIHTFTTNDKGEGSIWGFSSGNTYYIREESPAEGYSVPKGLIKMVLDNRGVADYTAMVVPDDTITDTAVSNPSPGFKAKLTVDETNQTLNLNVTNSLQEGETTEVYVRKVWEGTDTTPVTVYLLADGNRIREMTLNDDNDWQHVWRNLPKYKNGDPAEDGTVSKVEITYTVEEGIVPGYMGTIEPITESTSVTTVWNEAHAFMSNETYLLQSSGKYLATNANGGLEWVTEEVAKISNSAQWTVEKISGNDVTLKNVSYYLRYSAEGWDRLNFYASTDPGSVTFQDSHFQLRYYNQTLYMTTVIDGSGIAGASYNSYDQNIARFTLYQRTDTETSVTVNGLGFKITNKPIPDTKITSLTVTKRWTERDGETPFEDTALYQEYTVPVKLLADGVDSGRSGSLRLRNGWKYTFSGLQKFNSFGEEIKYTVVENWNNEDWTPRYTEVTPEDNGTYSVGITNVYSRKIDIPVEKNWDSSIYQREQESVEIRLYTAVGDNQTGTLVDTIVVSEETDWKGVLKAIPPEIENVSYYIYEATDQFAPEYGVPARIFIDGTSQRVCRVIFNSETGDAETSVVTNRPFIELPETGGSGTIPYTAGGALLMLAAWVLLYNKIFKRRRGAA